MMSRTASSIKMRALGAATALALILGCSLGDATRVQAATDVPAPNQAQDQSQILNQGTLSQDNAVLAQDIRTGNRTEAMALINKGANVNTPEADGSTPLLWAAYTVDLEMLKALLAHHANPNVANSFGASPLTEAVKIGNLDMVKALLKAGADANSANQDGETALMLSARVGFVPVAKELVDHNAQVNAIETLRGQTALMWAAGDNHSDMVKFLLSKGAKPDIRAFVNDWQNNVTSEPRAQYRPSAGLTALLYSTRAGCMECVQALLKAGANVDMPNPDGITPLMSAIDNLHFDMAKVLLDNKANPNLWDWWGRTPLYIAVDMDSFVNRAIGGLTGAGGGTGPAPRRGNDKTTSFELIQMLLARGVDPNTQLNMHRPGRGGNNARFTDDLLTAGCTPLLRASISYNVPVIQALLAHGAKVDLPNVMGVTPLVAASGMGLGVLVGGRQTNSGAAEDQSLLAKAQATLDTLIKAGADVNARVTDTSSHTARIARSSSMGSRQGQTALYGAISGGSPQLVQYLLDHGAQVKVTDAAGHTPLDAVQGKAGGREGHINPEVVALIQKASGVPVTTAAASPATSSAPTKGPGA